ncbi:hypothetical protein MKEN_00960700 [Mycena kentingensis (nom. inval.)]|nr:hypothetical protein MKEN_00960700 [Mycena kentingensis (nom. inval.)]
MFPATTLTRPSAQSMYDALVAATGCSDDADTLASFRAVVSLATFQSTVQAGPDVFSQTSLSLPAIAQRHRPSSAVYIGTDPISLTSPPDNHLPDLPEPPSPSSSSSSLSGLPSPPATNSTGSGSTTGGSIAIRGSNMLNGNNLKAFHAAFHPTENDNDDHEYDDNDDGEDNTARLDLRRHSASENVLALERVKSLTQRNKMALDKLSSYSRLNSPSPGTRAATLSSTRSPPPATPPSLLGSSSNSTSSSSHSSSSRPSIRRSRTQESGSETERDDVPSTSRPTTPLPAPGTRQRLISAPASPQKHLTAGSSSSGSSTRSPRRSRVSNLSFSTRAPRDTEGEVPSSPEDITKAALAAVASARRTPTGGAGTARYTGVRMSPTSTTGSGKRRQPLPREWGAGSNGRFSTEPPSSPPQHDTSPNKRHSLAGSTASYSPQIPALEQSPRPGHAHTNSTSSSTTIGSTAQGRERASTLARRQQTRWLSEDLSAASPSPAGIPDRERERRQSLRGGSAESALGVGAGRSLVGEGLRAAGLATRERERDRERDLFSSPAERLPRVEWAEGTRARSRSRSRHGRAATSMADYSSARRKEDDDFYDVAVVEPRTPGLRTYRSSAHVLEGTGRTGSAMGRLRERERGNSVEREEARDRDRAMPSPSPYGSMRRATGPGSISQHEHTRLMSESLVMLEGHLSRVVSANGGGSDLARHAQTVVGAADRLNAILRSNMQKALEAQIDAEVNGEGADGERAVAEGGAGGRESALAIRPSSVLNARHDVPARTGTPSSRRLLTPREQRELQASGIVPSDSQETVQPGMYEPSPTPATRKQQQQNHASSSGAGTLDRSRTLPPLAIPKPLPTLPSETAGAKTASSTLRRNQSTGDKPLPSGNSTQRRKTLTSGTVRGLHPSTTTPTTALTPHTVSNSNSDSSPNPSAGGAAGERMMTFPSLSRNDSDRSSGGGRTRNNTVTFSRPSNVALAGLQMQQERDRQRTISGPGTEEGGAVAGAGAAVARKRSVHAGTAGRTRMSLDGGEGAETRKEENGDGYLAAVGSLTMECRWDFGSFFLTCTYEQL